MTKKLLKGSSVDLIEIYQLDDSDLYIMEIVDFGHNMASDFRIIPPSQLQTLIENLDDKNFCESLSRDRTKYRAFKFTKLNQTH